jgi:hypothetical protein
LKKDSAFDQIAIDGSKGSRIACAGFSGGVAVLVQKTKDLTACANSGSVTQRVPLQFRQVFYLIK